MAHHVLITGASTGIGFATAALLHKRKYTVLAGVRKNEDATTLQSQIGCETCLLDVTKPDEISAAADLMKGRLITGDKVTLINNAGIAVGGPLECVPDEDMRQQFEVNVLGLAAMTRAMLPMIRKSGGRVINVSSIAGRLASPFLGPYAASKFAVEALTDSLRREMASFDVKVVSINPGVIKTPIWEKSITPLKDKYLDPNDERSAPYVERLTTLKAAVEESIEKGAHVEEVSRAVLKALKAKNPNTRYYIGKGVGFRATLARLLSDRVIDRMTEKRLET